MNRAELLHCMRDAAALLAEFRHLVPQHSLEAHHEVAQAREHFDRAVLLIRQTAPGADFHKSTRPIRLRDFD